MQENKNAITRQELINECYDFVNKVVKEPAKFVGVGEKDVQIRAQNQQVYDMCLRTLHVLETIKVMYENTEINKKSN